MFDNDQSPKERLRTARKEFRRHLSHWRDSHDEMRKASEFVHNTGEVGQWTNDEVRELEDLGLPSNTYNLVAHKVQSVVGLHEENRRKAAAQPVGSEDSLLADGLNAASDTVRKLIDLDTKDVLICEQALIQGEAVGHLSTQMDPQRPGWIKTTAKAVSGREVMWDPGSTERDRSDARHVFWHRWISKAELTQEYPDKEQEIRRLVKGQLGEGEGDQGMEIGEGPTGPLDDRDDYEAVATDPTFVDRKKGRLRLIHLEYKKPIRVHFLVDTDGAFKRINRNVYRGLQRQKRKDPTLPFEVTAAWDDEVWWLEFAGDVTLFDAKSPEPFDGFSLEPSVAYLDPETGYAYGMLRNLFDPQRDVNKSTIASLEQSVAWKGGTDIEDGAVADEKEFEKRSEAAASVRWFNTGALTSGAVRERTPPTINQAAVQRQQSSVELLDRISGIVSDAESPARNVEAAMTVAIREKKTLRALVQVIGNHWRYQKGMMRRIMEVITRAMPDAQIEYLIGNPQRYTVREGMLTDQEEQRQVPMRDFRSMVPNIDLEPSGESDTARLTQLNLVVQVAGQLGIPVDPEIIYELMFASRSMQERSKTFAKAQGEAQQQAAQQAEAQQQELTQAQLQLMARGQTDKAQTDAAKATEQARHNRASELQDFLSTLEKADEREEQLLMGLMQQIRNGQAARAGLAV